MNHKLHLSFNTAITIICLFVVCVLLYTVSVQDKERFVILLEIVEKQQKSLEVEQRIRQGLEREFYNLKNAVSTPEPVPTMIIRGLND